MPALPLLRQLALHAEYLNTTTHTLLNVLCLPDHLRYLEETITRRDTGHPSRIPCAPSVGLGMGKEVRLKFLLFPLTPRSLHTPATGRSSVKPTLEAGFAFPTTDQTPASCAEYSFWEDWKHVRFMWDGLESSHSRNFTGPPQLVAQATNVPCLPIDSLT
jgi:hypothetical protein